ncbi:MAG TPA: RdgB/HAM1 family non-canonical purine NTP pyrophosphatase [Miltoncostaeales bacterium]|jgi:XTP/dITP diphosphohydrolase|nr:RdgB/HAM1 family non-canonical purine NTP pyrophosphatase [Miltoncostaeales bacterium]
MLATGNVDKVREIAPLLAGMNVSGAPEGFDVDETGSTLMQNAWLKAAELRKSTDDDTLVIADDSGLFVHALGGRPGVFSSRYAGANATYADNCRRLLEELDTVDDRRACFATVLVGLGPNGTIYVAEGSCPGVITVAPRGDRGFGYDPVFQPMEDTAGRTMAQMAREEKGAISHRGRAIRRLVAMLSGTTPADTKRS